MSCLANATPALKYHPDRNPGKEQEVNSKFQIIQSAHEILSDPQQKARYDATLGQSSRVGASGVRGNPWSNVSQQFPTPPRRNAAARNATSGAQRWQTRFSNGVPPTAKQGAAADPEAKKNAARAFENMRKSQSHGGAKNAREPRPTQPPPPPPRTETARQRAEASFGARKPGHQPRSGGRGDEPPVSASSHYSSMNAGQQQPPPPPPRQPQDGPVPDPLSQFRDRDAYADARQSTPYTSHGGEKTNPFDGVPLSRAKSSREQYHRDEPSASDDGATGAQKSRSSSVPKSGIPTPDSYPPFTSGGTGGNASFNARANASNLHEPRDPTTGASNRKLQHMTYSAATGSLTFSLETGPQGQGASGQPLYATPCDMPPSACSSFPVHDCKHTRYLQSSVSAFHEYELGQGLDPNEVNRHGLASSGDQDGIHSLTPFELRQHLLLDHLIKNKEAVDSLEQERMHAAKPNLDSGDTKDFADQTLVTSFTFPVGHGNSGPTSPSTGENPFARRSVDDINTQFANDDSASTWQFNAGSGQVQDEHAPRRPSSGGRNTRRSPLKRPTMRPAEPPTTEAQAEPSETHPTGFNAEGWNDKFGPQTFVPQPTPGASASPTRRANSKKVKARPTAGSAAVIDEDTSEGETYEWRGRNTGTKPTTVDSPQAMDIDSPPTAPTAASSESNSARNIPVEPTRPEWRPGNVDGVAGDDKPPRPDKIPMDPNTMGSEDSEDIRASFADLKNVAPFANDKSGLRSLDDLKDNLPFESKPSEEIPIRKPKAPPLDFPSPPEAPRLPPTVAIEGMKPNAASWSKYVEDFEGYLRKWDEFNGQVVDHFATRKSNIASIRAAKGYTFLGARGDGDIQSYAQWVQQDNDVRQRWTVACEEHERRLREFMAFREKMK
ncbi:DnaJ domain protein [Purpureocillium lavendulum]|uniref:DnaJ domain protein n=1 Tax=Purpureocillium lavendulum TaxID=1247861 RepID=A0AB34FYP5_9HYPO|nr:DnaJ domain protein [Purpureocillium lavendulum]